MTRLSNILIQKDILLESGTNEVEILVFSVGQYRLGINVAKVREVLNDQTITVIPESHPSLLGCFRLRNVLVPCVSLRRHLGEPEADGEHATILTEFNQAAIAFQVDHVERIHRISWSDVLPVPASIAADGAPVTAVANIENRLVVMLDFETIAEQLNPTAFDQSGVDNLHDIPRHTIRTLFVDDSSAVRNAVRSTMAASGYTQVTCLENGQLAWEYLCQGRDVHPDHDTPCDLVISDVEMPCMDGLHLTRRIKEDPTLRRIPVILFSSILTPGNRKKADAVGADAQITKPELRRIVSVADEVILRNTPREPHRVPDCMLT